MATTSGLDDEHVRPIIGWPNIVVVVSQIIYEIIISLKYITIIEGKMKLFSINEI